jgi:hypothetical protein
MPWQVVCFPGQVHDSILTPDEQFGGHFFLFWGWFRNMPNEYMKSMRYALKCSAMMPRETTVIGVHHQVKRFM